MHLPTVLRSRIRDSALIDGFPIWKPPRHLTPGLAIPTVTVHDGFPPVRWRIYAIVSGGM